MEGLRFNLSGDFAFFRKPEYNNFDKTSGSHYFISFNQIPKTYLLGFLGSLLGFPSFDKKDNYYFLLKDLKVSIIPEEPHFLKERHTYQDHTGKLYLTKGENIIVTEELLYKPSWDVVLSEEHRYYKLIKDFLLNKKAKCHLYLGKNEFFANINDVRVVELENFEIPDFVEINSMFRADKLNEKDFQETINPYLYKEYLPFKFDDENKYEYDLFYFTNQPVKTKKIKGKLYKTEGEIICLF